MSTIAAELALWLFARDFHEGTLHVRAPISQRF
jgi:hypothetical protein